MKPNGMLTFLSYVSQHSQLSQSFLFLVTVESLRIVVFGFSFLVHIIFPLFSFTYLGAVLIVKNAFAVANMNSTDTSPL